MAAGAIPEWEYVRWLALMSAAGVNAVRVYTLHYPRFYEALVEHNRYWPTIYVLHGVWLDEDNPGFDLTDMTDDFDDRIRETVDAVHGDAVIDHRYGMAYGDYQVDASRWVIGWIIGREVFPEEVLTTNTIHGDDTSYAGDALCVDDGSPTETWATERLDTLVAYERETFGVERPVSFSSWPTLDPLTHITEPSQDPIRSHLPRAVRLPMPAPRICGS